MPKQKKKNTKEALSPTTVGGRIAESRSEQLWYTRFRIQAVVLLIMMLICYSNTVNNEYALDDNIVIVKNEFVYQGLAGIPGILGHDAFYSYCNLTNSANLLAGGRYRPLSIATFAAEQQLLGTVPDMDLDSVVQHAGLAGPQQDKLISDMHARHGFNLIWAGLLIVVILYFLRCVVFPHQPLVAFVAALLFLVHPVHSEVIANIKSRDEIMSLLFICLTFIATFRHLSTHRPIWLIAALAAYFLALLSKEYALNLVVLLPLSFYLFKDFPFKKSVALSGYYFAVAVLYFVIRFSIVGFNHTVPDTDVWNNPYALATGAQTLATKIAALFFYIRVLIAPWPLSSDYSYASIPYTDFADFKVWISLLVHAALIALTIWSIRKKQNIIAFALAFYLLNLFMVSNLVVDTGGTVGERLIFHSSLGFSILLGWLISLGAKYLKPASVGIIASSILVSVLCLLGTFLTIMRNPDWKNDFSLFSHDVKIQPNSLLLNANLGVAWINKADTEKDSLTRADDLNRGIVLLNKAIAIYPKCLPAYVNRGLAWFRLGEPDSALTNYDKLYELIPGFNQLPGLYYNLGVYYFLHRRYPEAESAWKRTLQLNPGNDDAKHALMVLGQQRTI